MPTIPLLSTCEPTRSTVEEYHGRNGALITESGKVQSSNRKFMASLFRNRRFNVSMPPKSNEFRRFGAKMRQKGSKSGAKSLEINLLVFPPNELFGNVLRRRNSTVSCGCDGEIIRLDILPLCDGTTGQLPIFSPEQNNLYAFPWRYSGIWIIREESLQNSSYYYNFDCSDLTDLEFSKGLNTSGYIDHISTK